METRLCAMCEMSFTPTTPRQLCCCSEHSKEYKKWYDKFLYQQQRDKAKAEHQEPVEKPSRKGVVKRSAVYKLTNYDRELLGKPKANVFKDPKKNDKLEKEAAALGMSYGQIQSHRYAGDLEQVVNRMKTEVKGDNIYKSWIGGGGHGAKGIKI